MKMTNRDNLDRIVEDLIARNAEGVYWDFKRKHHTNKGDLIHDVLCLANADHTGPRFLIFGVDNADFSLHAVDASSGRRTQADIASLFRDNARKFFQSRFPTFHLREIEINRTPVDVLVIEDEPKKMTGEGRKVLALRSIVGARTLCPVHCRNRRRWWPGSSIRSREVARPGGHSRGLEGPNTERRCARGGRWRRWQA